MIHIPYHSRERNKYNFIKAEMCIQRKRRKKSTTCHIVQLPKHSCRLSYFVYFSALHCIVNKVLIVHVYMHACICLCLTSQSHCMYNTVNIERCLVSMSNQSRYCVVRIRSWSTTGGLFCKYRLSFTLLLNLSLSITYSPFCIVSILQIFFIICMRRAYVVMPLFLFYNFLLPI